MFLRILLSGRYSNLINVKMRKHSYSLPADAFSSYCIGHPREAKWSKCIYTVNTIPSEMKELLLAPILANLFTDRNATIWDECITQGTLCAGSIVAGSISNPVPVALKGLI
jgi:hypothetical protein